jgi:hypothetical protein
MTFPVLANRVLHRYRGLDSAACLSLIARPLFRSSDREAAVGVEEVQVAGIHCEVDPGANADRAARVSPRRPQRLASV